MSTITAFAGNAAFLAAAVLAVNAGKIKDIFDGLSQDKKKPIRKPIKKSQPFDLSEELIQKLAQDRFSGVIPRPSLVEEFKTKMRNLFKLPPMRELIPKLSSSIIKEQSKQKTTQNQEPQQQESYPKSPYPPFKNQRNGPSIHRNRPTETQHLKRRPQIYAPSFGPPLHIHKNFKPPSTQNTNFPSSDAGFR
jgi:hypothetical protein